MNIHEYISTGILEAYVLGELSDQERRAVEENLARYPELKAELDAVEATHERLMMETAIAPRPAVRAALFDQLDERKPAARQISLTPETGTRTIQFWKLAAAASVSLAVVSSYLAFRYWDKWQNTQTSLNDLIAQNERMAQDYNKVNLRLDEIEGDLQIINSASFERVVMAGTPNAPEAMAYVYWNAATEEVYLDIRNMRALSKNNQYQLWAIIDGKPVDAGVFDNIAGRLLRMKDIGSGATTFAVTVEPRGGKPSPSLETMQVAGQVKPQG